MSKFVVGISHRPDIPERVECLAKMLDQFSTTRTYIEEGLTEAKPACAVWAPRLWHNTLKLAKQTGAENCMFLQDDLELCPDFMQVCEQMLHGGPGIICLHTPHWRFADVKGCWASSRDGLVGNAYWMSTRYLEEFLVFREHDLKQDTRRIYNEDSTIALWAMATDRKIYHPLPSPIDCPDLKSTWGADEHLYRKPVVCYKDTEFPESWSDVGAEDIGLIYEQEFWRLRGHLTKEAVEKYDVVRKMYALAPLRNPRVRPV